MMVSLALLLASSAAQQQQCRQAPDEESAVAASTLQNGLTFLWTTPMLRLQMLDPAVDAEALQSLAANIEAQFREFEGDCVTRRGETANDAFFQTQLDAWEADDETFLDSFDGDTRLVRTLREGWLSNIEAYVAGAAGEDAAAELFRERERLHLFVWASVIAMECL